MSLKKILETFGMSHGTKKIPAIELRDVLIGGGKEHTQDIGFYGRMLIGNIPNNPLRVGDLVVRGNLENNSEVYEVLSGRYGEVIPETEKVNVKAIGRIKFNEIYLEARAKRARGELYGSDPPESRIDLILYEGTKERGKK